MRLYMNKVKTEAKVLHSRVNQLEEERVQNIQLMRKSEEESKDYAIRVREVNLPGSTNPSYWKHVLLHLSVILEVVILCA